MTKTTSSTPRRYTSSIRAWLKQLVLILVLIAVAWFEIIKISIINVSKFLQTNNLLDVVINFKALIIFLVIFFLTKKFDKHPIVFIGIGALAGIVFKL